MQSHFQAGWCFVRQSFGAGLRVARSLRIEGRTSKCVASSGSRRGQSSSPGPVNDSPQPAGAGFRERGRCAWAFICRVCQTVVGAGSLAEGVQRRTSEIHDRGLVPGCEVDSGALGSTLGSPLARQPTELGCHLLLTQPRRPQRLRGAGVGVRLPIRCWKLGILCPSLLR